MIFFDTYALFEILNGNPAYKELEEEDLVTSVLNIGELHYGLIKTGNKDGVEKVSAWKFDIVDIEMDTMKKAMEFRFTHRKKNLSMVDCVGYCLAKKFRIPFLTGDKEFEDLPHVTFIK